MNRKDFDQLFDQAFDDAARSSQFVPDPAPSWARIEKKLAQRAKFRRRLKAVPYVAASFLLGAYIFGTPAVTTAFKPVIEAVSSIRDGVVEITVGKKDGDTTVPKTAPPPGFVEEGDAPVQDGEDLSDSAVVSVKHKTIKEAAKHLAFAAPELRYVPEAFELSSIETYQDGNKDKSDLLSIQYVNKSGNSGMYRITVRKWQKDMVMKITNDDPAIPTESIVLNGYEAYLQVTEDGSASVQYFADDLHVMIVGILGRDDAIRIAEGIRLH